MIPGQGWAITLAVLAALGVPRPASAAASTGRRVLLVALDAADWQAIDPLAAAGRLPTLARLSARGSTSTMVATPPLVSPIIWTTIATGRRPEDHRVLDFMVDLPGGGQAPVPSSERKTAALWNVFSDAGRSVGVVGWWATWPAEAVKGTVVSDRVSPQLVRSEMPIERGSVSPPALAGTVAGWLVQATDLRREDLLAYLPLSAAEYDETQDALRNAGGRLYRDPLAHLAAIVASTRSYGRIAEGLVAAGQPDLLLVYLEMIDSVSHLFARDRRRGPGAIARAYEDADALVGRLAARVAPDTWVVVVSDHGFYGPDAGIREDPSDLAGPATAWHRPYGVVAAAEARDLVKGGPAVPARPRAGFVTPLDVAPTVLHAAGLPTSREMPGKVVTALLPEEAAARPVVRVDTLERPRRPAEAVTLTPDPAARERLQALGYVGAATTSLARLNLGEILYRRGDLDGAERELRAVVEAQPTNLSALLWLAKALGAQGHARSALDVYARALALPGDSGDALVEAVELAAQAKLPDEARRMLAAARAKDRTSAAGAVSRAIAANLDGHAEAAERELRLALSADPTFLPALERLLDLCVASGRATDAVAPLTEAADRLPRSPRHQALAGMALLASADARGAEQRLARAAALAPDASSVRVELARAQLKQGRADAALATLAAVTASAEADALRGAAYSTRREWARAAAAYEAALAAGSATPDLLNALAWARVQLGQKPEAVQLLTRSLALQSGQPEIRKLLAEIQRQER
ncbi:MAG TPA: alkaline phosphatase family protein [Vicinamibacteria bacterium]|nr:alkaline phosphatase family protein [Vicinamibacteria bacterium]